MDIRILLTGKALKPKERTESLARWLSDKKVSLSEVLDFAATAKDPVMAACIEALEIATRQQPSIADASALQFVTDALTHESPRVKWESARVIANTAHLFPEKLDETVANLLVNTGHTGTVVRWSAALALGEILKLRTSQNKILLPALESVMKRENKNSILKIYRAALKKLKQDANAIN